MAVTTHNTEFTLRRIRASVRQVHFGEADSADTSAPANCASAAGPFGSLSRWGVVNTTTLSEINAK